MNQHKNSSHARSPRPASASPSMAAVGLNQSGIDFTPPADEVAKRAYLSYVNEGAPQGRDVQHWLAAEAELIAEGRLSRIRGFYNSI
jgi:hypothetical protein